jgi:molecular chaperone GrpE
MAFSESFALWLQSAPDTPESRVLRAKLDALLEQFNLSIVAETGVPFDPSFHEACAVRSDPGRPEGYVLEVVRPGFASDGEVLRCAAVVVNRPLAPEESETEGLVETE